MVALTKPDQLRQRVAFALSQILVVTPLDLTDDINTETMVNYYDIFVRNAFGNYRNVLREVSYSQRMGGMLSYLKNKAQQHFVDIGDPVAFPDENFAREIMQLFTIGLCELNIDGTCQKDENGGDIATYDNVDIAEFSNYAAGCTTRRVLRVLVST